MSHRRLTLLALSIAGLTGCATANRAGVATGAGDQPALGSRRTAAAEAHNRLQHALEQRDRVQVEATLHADVELIVASRDTVRGRTGVAHYLMTVAADSVQTLRLTPATFEPCADGGVLEYDGWFSSAPIRGLDGERRFGILWNADGEQVSAQRLVLAADRSGVSNALSCRFAYLVAGQRHRLTTFVSAELNVPGTSRAADNVLSVMRADGLNFAAIRPTPGPEAKPYPFVKRGVSGVGASMRYRFQPAYSAELQVAYRFPETVVGLSNVLQRYATAERAPLTVGALAQMQRGPVRVGAGPALLLGNWTVVEEHRRTYSGESRSYWATMDPESQVVRDRALSLGGAAELAFTLPMTERLLGEARASVAAFGGSDVPPTETFSGAHVSNVLIKLGFAIGMGW